MELAAVHQPPEVGRERARRPAEIVEEQRGAFGLLDQPRGALLAGPLVAEELDPHELLGDRRDVARDQRARPAGARGVERPRHHLLADAARAVDQGVAVVAHDEVDGVPQRPDRRALPHQAGGVRGAELVHRAMVRVHERWEDGRARDAEQQELPLDHHHVPGADDGVGRLDAAQQQGAAASVVEGEAVVGEAADVQLLAREALGEERFGPQRLSRALAHEVGAHVVRRGRGLVTPAEDVDPAVVGAHPQQLARARGLVAAPDDRERQAEVAASASGGERPGDLFGGVGCHRGQSIGARGSGRYCGAARDRPAGPGAAARRSDGAARRRVGRAAG